MNEHRSGDSVGDPLALPRSIPLTRRAALRAGLGSLATLALGGCATAGPRGDRAGMAPRPRPRLVAPRVAPERIIRTTAGLRPYRAPGFVVRADAYGDKVVVHNYGHGGGGISLAWGSAWLAADLAQETGHRRAAVLGAGVMGLTTARLLQDRGFAVTIYARELPPYTTSNLSGGQWNPSSVFSFGEASAAFLGQFGRAASIAWRHYQSLVGGRYGVRWVDNYVLLDSPPSGSAGGLRALIPEAYTDDVVLGPGEHPFPSRYVQRFTTMLVEPAILLDTLGRDVLLRGGRIEVRELRALPEVLALDEPLVVNCTGLGAAALFGDDALVPVKGQLAVLVPDDEVDYIAQQGGWYMFPRSDGIVLGGSFERGVWTLDNDAATIAGIVEGNRRMFEGMT